MGYKFKTFVDFFRYDIPYGIQNLFIYAKTIWLDRDWDYTYMFQLFAKKFERMERLHRKYGCSANSTKYADQLKVCKNLCQRLADDEYWLTEHRDWQHADKLQRDDLEYLCQMVSKRSLRWWD